MPNTSEFIFSIKMKLILAFFFLLTASPTVLSAEVKKSDIVGVWKCTFVSGKRAEEIEKIKFHFKEDGTVSTAGEGVKADAMSSWFFATMEDGRSILLLDQGSGDDFLAMIVSIEEGEMKLSPFIRKEEGQPLLPVDQAVYRLKKERKE